MVVILRQRKPPQLSTGIDLPLVSSAQQRALHSVGESHLTHWVCLATGQGPHEAAPNKNNTAQCLNASVVLTSSVNGVVGKKGSVAHDTSKAAANHLVRELAIEMALLVRVNAVAPRRSSQVARCSPETASSTKYGIEFPESDSDDELRNKLAQFYAERTLTRQPITPADQAEAIYFLSSIRSCQPTKQIRTKKTKTQIQTVQLLEEIKARNKTRYDETS